MNRAQVRACSLYGITYNTQLLTWSVRDRKMDAMVDFWNRQQKIQGPQENVFQCDEKSFRERWPSHYVVKISGWYAI